MVAPTSAPPAAPRFLAAFSFSVSKAGEVHPAVTIMVAVSSNALSLRVLAVMFRSLRGSLGCIKINQMGCPVLFNARYCSDNRWLLGYLCWNRYLLCKESNNLNPWVVTTVAKDLFANLDLNLLRTFIILHQERNMRKAAERLFVSQPAVSKALQRLRDHFSDELFVKTHTGLRATEYANKLADSIAPLMNDLSMAVNASNEFDAAQLTGPLKIAVTPFILSYIATDLFNAIRMQAPDAQIQLLNWSKSTMQDLINDDVQVGVHYDIAHAPKELSQHLCMTDQYYIYMRKAHSFAGQHFVLEDGAELEFATVIAADWNSHTSIIERLYKLRGIQPRIAFRSELPSVVMNIVSETDMVFPSSGLLNLAADSRLRKVPVLFDNSAVNSAIFTYFHYKNRNNATTQWLCRTIKSVLTDPSTTVFGKAG